jgi:hypothetical protein
LSAGRCFGASRDLPELEEEVVEQADDRRDKEIFNRPLSSHTLKTGVSCLKRSKLKAISAADRSRPCPDRRAILETENTLDGYGNAARRIQAASIIDHTSRPVR